MTVKAKEIKKETIKKAVILDQQQLQLLKEFNTEKFLEYYLLDENEQKIIDFLFENYIVKYQAMSRVKNIYRFEISELGKQYLAQTK